MRKGHQSQRKPKNNKTHESKYLGTQERLDYTVLVSEISTSDIVNQSQSFYDKYMKIKDNPTRDNYNQLKAMYKVATGQMPTKEKGKHLDSYF